ncbi:Stk1 family PASTA domain-containing Ser/Thr kinase [Virgibacillus oceani]
MLNGRLLNERYQIKETIGGGGMANVYLAKDIILDREVAIKVLRLEYANDEEFIARFDREAQSATSLSHPNIVNIYDVGEEEHILFMVMEYVDGMTLKEYILQRGPLKDHEALDIMKQITAAITHAHANGIVHRDIKPQNILMDSHGQVKVTDFGIAMALSATSLTQTNSILGSVHYLSPEQARGGMATKKSDIYSIGIVLFELLTGRLPFSGESPVSIALKHLQNDTPSVRRFNQDIPQSVENIVLKATAKDPFHRYETVVELEQVLKTAMDPDKINEEVYTPPVEAGEETKAIPIITDNHIQDANQDTIVHHSNGTTKNLNEGTENEETIEKAGGAPAKKKKGKKNKNKKKKKKGKKKWIIFLVLFILLASGAAALFIIPGILQPQDVTVPDVSEMEYDEAVEELEMHNLMAEEELIFSEDIEEGLVTRSEPRAGRTVKENTTITLYVSRGKETVNFSDYVGRDYSQVRRLLEDEGFEVIAYEEFSDRPVGEIITQIQPNPNTDVVPSETRVIFEVSEGPDLVSLSNLRGVTEQEARDYLEENNLVMNLHEENSDSPEGEVTRQEPAANTELEEGSTVDVYISIGPEELPPVSHAVNYTVPFEPDEEIEEETVRVYISDMNNDLSEVYIEEAITEDTPFEFALTIAPGDEGEYIIMLGDDVVFNETISYEEGG